MKNLLAISLIGLVGLLLMKSKPTAIPVNDKIELGVSVIVFDDPERVYPDGNVPEKQIDEFARIVGQYTAFSLRIDEIAHYSQPAREYGKYIIWQGLPPDFLERVTGQDIVIMFWNNNDDYPYASMGSDMTQTEGTLFSGWIRIPYNWTDWMWQLADPNLTVGGEELCHEWNHIVQSWAWQAAQVGIASPHDDVPGSSFEEKIAHRISPLNHDLAQQIREYLDIPVQMTQD